MISSRLGPRLTRRWRSMPRMRRSGKSRLKSIPRGRQKKSVGRPRSATTARRARWRAPAGSLRTASTKMRSPCCGAYEDAHPAVAAGLAELVAAHEAALKRAREEEEKKRRAAQAQALAGSNRGCASAGGGRQARRRHRKARGFRPQHPDIVSAIAELRVAAAQAEAERHEAEVRQREDATRAALAEAEELAGKGDFDAALDCVDAALVENPTSRPAQDLRRRLARAREAKAAEIKRTEHDAAAATVVATARATFERGEHDAALEPLERFSPPHGTWMRR